MDQVFADEQVKLLGMAAPVEHPELGLLHVLSSPLNFEGVHKRIHAAAPEPGANTDAILSELGYAQEKINKLHATGVCWSSQS